MKGESLFSVLNICVFDETRKHKDFTMYCVHVTEPIFLLCFQVDKELLVSFSPRNRARMYPLNIPAMAG